MDFLLELDSINSFKQLVGNGDGPVAFFMDHRLWQRGLWIEGYSPFDAAVRLQDNSVVRIDRYAAMPSFREESEKHCISIGEAFRPRDLKLGSCHRSRRRVAFLNGSFCAVEDFYAGE